MQPLDIGVFKSFKSEYSKACRRYLTANPGRVITSEVIASLIGETWARSITPVNILSGFKKSGIFPLNPSEVCDRMLAPSITTNPLGDSASASSTPSFSDDQITLYEKRYAEDYDLHDPQYERWVRENHPGSSDTDSLKTHVSHSSSDKNTKTCSNSTSDLSEILKYPEVKPTSRTKKPGLNSKHAVCLSDSPVVQQLKQKEQKKQCQEEKMKEKVESEKRREEREKKRLLKEKERGKGKKEDGM